jgi:hypothetical protein
MRCSKAVAMKRHTARRAAERFGMGVNMDDLARLIQQKQGRFVERQSVRVTVWDVEYKGTTLRVVYDKKRGMPVTVLNTWMGRQTAEQTTGPL